MQFPLLERIKLGLGRYRDGRGTRTHSLLESGLITAASAGAAGSVTAVATTPVDVVKTRIMLAAVENAVADQEPRQASSSLSRGRVLDATGKPVHAARDGLSNVKSGLAKAAVKVAKAPGGKGSMQIAREIVRDHGVKGLFRGGAL